MRGLGANINKASEISSLHVAPRRTVDAFRCQIMGEFNLKDLALAGVPKPHVAGTAHEKRHGTVRNEAKSG